MTKFSASLLFAVFICLSEPWAAGPRQPDIAIEIENAPQDSGSNRLLVRLRNTTMNSIYVPLVNVPWLTRRSFAFVVAPIDRFPTALAQSSPLAQDAIGEDILVPAGKTIQGIVDLNEHVSGLTDARRRSRIGVHWLYRPPLNPGGHFVLQGGFVEIGP